MDINASVFDSQPGRFTVDYQDDIDFFEKLFDNLNKCNKNLSTSNIFEVMNIIPI